LMRVSSIPSGSGVVMLDASSVRQRDGSVAVCVTLPLTACNTVWGVIKRREGVGMLGNER
jgi:hypothetical protein